MAGQSKLYCTCHFKKKFMTITVESFPLTKTALINIVNLFLIDSVYFLFQGAMDKLLRSYNEYEMTRYGIKKYNFPAHTYDIVYVCEDTFWE